MCLHLWSSSWHRRKELFCIIRCPSHEIIHKYVLMLSNFFSQTGFLAQESWAFYLKILLIFLLSGKNQENFWRKFHGHILVRNWFFLVNFASTEWSYVPYSSRKRRIERILSISWKKAKRNWTLSLVHCNIKKLGRIDGCQFENIIVPDGHSSTGVQFNVHENNSNYSRSAFFQICLPFRR